MFAKVYSEPLLVSSTRKYFERRVTTPGLQSRMYVRYDNGDLVIITPLAGGYQEIEDVFASDHPPLKYKAYRGLYIVWEYEPCPNGKPMKGSGMRVQFPIPMEELPEPVPGASWKGEIVKTFDDESRVTSMMEIGFSACHGITLGGVNHDVVRADLVFDRGSAEQLQVQYLYLPKLDTALFVSSEMASLTATRIAPTGLIAARH